MTMEWKGKVPRQELGKSAKKFSWIRFGSSGQTPATRVSRSEPGDYLVHLDHTIWIRRQSLLYFMGPLSTGWSRKQHRTKCGCNMWQDRSFPIERCPFCRLTFSTQMRRDWRIDGTHFTLKGRRSGYGFYETSNITVQNAKALLQKMPCTISAIYSHF